MRTVEGARPRSASVLMGVARNEGIAILCTRYIFNSYLLLLGDEDSGGSKTQLCLSADGGCEE
jgi:hypothetical protein